MTDLEIKRAEIDKIDAEISKLLSARFKAVRQIKEIKAKNGQEIKDNQREKEILDKIHSENELEVFKTIIAESRKIQALL